MAFKKQGVLVFRTGQRLTAAVVRATIEKVRKEREQQVLGKMARLNNEPTARELRLKERSREA